MAKVISKVAFDMRSTGDMSVHDLLKGRDAKFDNHFIRLEYRKSHERDTFKGSFSADPGRKTISGSAKSWTHSKDGRLQWEITNASISASAVLKAAQTNKTKDDLAVIEKTFAGNDQITGSKFADKLFGYNGNDTIDGGLGGGIDKIDGGSGHDRVSYADSSKAFVVTLTGATISTVLANGVSDDRIINIEDVAGGKAADIITGDKKANLLIGNNGADLLTGLKGNDTLLGGNQSDTLNGGAGKDLLDGGKGADVLLGGGSDDTLLGGKGADSLDGGAGKDSLNGGAGVDLLIGGGGRDTMTGGSEADTFRFTDVGQSGLTATDRDLITDFKHKQDKIDLSAIDAISSTVGIDDAFTWDGKGTVKTKHAEGHFGYYQVNAKGTANDHTYIVVNNDSDKAPEMTIELQGLVKLGPIDFIL